jgi:ABC-2 type transport system permease protein
MGFGKFFFHLAMPSSGEKWVRLLWLILLGSVCSTVLGIAFSALPKNGRGASAIVSPIVIVLQFFSGVFFVFTDLPKWMQQFASIFPLKWLTQGMRSVFLPDGFAVRESAHGWEVGRIFVILLAWAVVGTILAVRTFRWSNK